MLPLLGPIAASAETQGAFYTANSPTDLFKIGPTLQIWILSYWPVSTNKPRKKKKKRKNKRTAAGETPVVNYGPVQPPPEPFQGQENG
ncbi:hypothetical protein UY3_13999 [Chelonia mydas]|uniref:Uncharacterized protein n=1 Tax=Chelonia mydas TaxID=8469 RepID=M7ATZ7_CHEMY|nr:hypothetical protein UY3_13999 [Chelonia mydas]